MKRDIITKALEHFPERQQKREQYRLIVRRGPRKHHSDETTTRPDIAQEPRPVDPNQKEKKLRLRPEDIWMNRGSRI